MWLSIVQVELLQTDGGFEELLEQHGRYSQFDRTTYPFCFGQEFHDRQVFLLLNAALFAGSIYLFGQYGSTIAL